MPYTQTQLDALKAAYAMGVTRVSFEGKSLDFASSADLLKAINTIQADLNGQAGIVSKRQVRIYATKGLGF
jgi:hypothetical protein